MANDSFKIKKSLNLEPQSTPPSNPSLGDHYVDTAGRLNEWNGTAWKYVGPVTASELANVASGNITATDVQSALNQVQTHVDTNSSNISTNTSNIATNTTNIATNTASINTINGKIGAASGIATLDASGLVPITQIPPAALERLVVVADQTARFALTTTTVQNGDTVKQTDTGVMYFVSDQTNLGNSAGYSVYSAGTASSVAWSGVTGVPAAVSAVSGTNTGDQTITLTGDVTGSGTGSFAASIAAGAVTDAKVASGVSASKISGNISGNAANVTGTVAIANGGTGQTTANAALNVLLPTQASAATKYLQSDGTNTAWAAVAASSGGINYVTNPDAETNTAGYATYADAAATSPVDGTGGSPSVTLTRTTTSPLRKTGSFLITKGATNRQGDGVSYDFTIDSADQAKVISVSYDFNASTGFVASSGATGSDSDIEMYLYDVTNALLIPISPKVITASGANNFTFRGTFQTASNSTSYRLIWHVATTNATAWTFKFDNVAVTPSSSGSGSVPAPTVQKILTGSSTYITPSPAPLYIRVRAQGAGASGGSSGTASTATGNAGGATTFGPITANGGVGGAGGAGGNTGGAGGTASLGTGPIGVALTGAAGTGSANANAVVGGNGGASPFGGAGAGVYGASGGAAAANTGSGGAGGGGWGGGGGAAGGGSGGFVDAILSGATLVASFSYAVGAGGASKTAGTSGFASGAGADGLIIVDEFYAPAVSASEGDGRVVSLSANKAGGSVTANTTIPSWTTLKDTHSAFNATTGVYIVAVAGDYFVAADVAVTTAATPTPAIYKNGTLYASGVGSSTSQSGVVSTLVTGCVPGDQITVAIAASLTLFATATYNTLTINRLSGAASIAATESVNGRYHATSSTITGSLGVVAYSTKDWDTHGAYNTSTGIWTCPVSGKYQFNAAFASSATTYAAGNFSQIELLQAGSATQASDRFVGIWSSTQTPIDPTVSDIFNCLAGDTIKVQALCTAGTPVITSSNSRNTFSWSRVGN